MKKFSKILALMLALLLATGCSTNGGGDEPTTTPDPEVTATAPGVTDTEILVGNTTATSGALASVGVPFNDALVAAFKEVNDAGGIDGRKITFITYDDGFSAATGTTLTEKLVEEDGIFALVGHFGTPTVGATVNYIEEYGIPMVYAATGINALYFLESPANPVMAVQPIYKTDGRIMTARAFKEALYGEAFDQPLAEDAKIGVLYTNDDVGNSILEGVNEEAAVLGKTDSLVVEAVAEGTYATAVQKLKDEGVAAVILAMNQEPFKQSLVAISDADLTASIFTSYVNADVTVVDHTKYGANRPIYTNAWVDVFSDKGQAEVAAYVTTINQADLSEELKAAYLTNAFAMSGYIAAQVFIEGLERVAANGEDLTWETYIAAMEDGAINIPMGGTVDFSDGKRWGIDSMSLLQYTFTGSGDDVAEVFIKVREIETLSEIEGK